MEFNFNELMARNEDLTRTYMEALMEREFLINLEKDVLDEEDRELLSVSVETAMDIIMGCDSPQEIFGEAADIAEDMMSSTESEEG